MLRVLNVSPLGEKIRALGEPGENRRGSAGLRVGVDERACLAVTGWYQRRQLQGSSAWHEALRTRRVGPGRAVAVGRGDAVAVDVQVEAHAVRVETARHGSVRAGARERARVARLARLRVCAAKARRQLWKSRSRAASEGAPTHCRRGSRQQGTRRPCSWEIAQRQPGSARGKAVSNAPVAVVEVELLVAVIRRAARMNSVSTVPRIK